jgi:hypothetical protein
MEGSAPWQVSEGLGLISRPLLGALPRRIYKRIGVLSKAAASRTHSKMRCGVRVACHRFGFGVIWARRLSRVSLSAQCISEENAGAVTTLFGVSARLENIAVS